MVSFVGLLVLLVCIQFGPCTQCTLWGFETNPHHRRSLKDSSTTRFVFQGAAGRPPGPMKFVCPVGASLGPLQDSVHSAKVAYFPQTVCPHYGVLTVVVRSGVLQGVLLQPRFRLRRLAQSSVCDGCPCTFWSKTWQAQEIGWFWRVETWVYVAGARKPTLEENRGRRRILWTLAGVWSFEAGAGNSHRGSYVWRAKGSISEKGCIFCSST